MVYALDTNILIHLVRSSPAICAKRNAVVENGDSLIIPPFANYEMRRGFLYRQAPAKEKAYQVFCDIFSVGEMNSEIWECAARIYADLRRAGRTVEDADLLIAAFCIVGGHTLVTHNVRHFENIGGLKIEDWLE